ncbi:MAG: molybdopterin-guanine dinucleotide biosynthesis protein B [Hyphomicrobiales bacterium]|nr:molybdopterin-guanine dinucleotide biosynthesis protein B [Hyphomicrobiales bacterium]
MKVLGLAGWSGSGKTTLLVALLPALTARGFHVSTIKHVHGSVDLDRPGKDSYRHREAGAGEVLVLSAKRWTLIHELRDEREPTLDELIARMTPVDLILVEGFKRWPHDKIEVHRPVLGKPLLCRNDDSIIAVASDQPLAGLHVPVFRLEDTEDIAAFIMNHHGMDKAR